MTPRSFKQGIEGTEGYCRECKWKSLSETVAARSAAQHHVKTTGHVVDVYTESRSVMRLSEPQR